MRWRLRPVAGVVGALGRALVDFFLPERCVVCGRVLSSREHYLCCHCDADLPLTKYSLRERQPMSERYNAAIQRVLTASGPDLSFDVFQRAAALFFYQEDAGYKHIPQVLKYDGRLALGRYFGLRLGRELAGSPLFADVDWVVPVPLHRWRHFRRGYNQAAVLAKAIVQAYASDSPASHPQSAGLPSAVPHYADGLLIRARATKTQTKLSGEEKAKNVANAFRVDSQALARFSFRPRHILVVDDVFTTGSTLCAVYEALRAVFPPEIRISVATLAFVSGD